MVLFSSNLLIDFTGDYNLNKITKIVFDYDVLRWRQSRYKNTLQKVEKPCLFYLSDEKKKALDVLINQYKLSNKNVAMRKMSEYMRISDLYYDVKNI